MEEPTEIVLTRRQRKAALANLRTLRKCANSSMCRADLKKGDAYAKHLVEFVDRVASITDNNLLAAECLKFAEEIRELRNSQKIEAENSAVRIEFAGKIG